MTTEQQRNILEAAAKACGIDSTQETYFDHGVPVYWNPITSSDDCAEMCAELCINTTYWWGSKEVECQCFFVKDFVEFFNYKTELADHDNSRLKAWRHAATMVAAKIGGYCG